MNNLTTTLPHDALFKQFLTRADAARDFLQCHLPPAMLRICDLDTLKLEHASFIEPDLRALHSDVLWSLETRHGRGYIYALIEHQSSPDRHMAFRLMHYAMAAMKRHLDAGHDHLPLVIPMLFYNGRTSPYPYSLNWLQEFQQPALAGELYSGNFPLIDVTVISDDEIMRHRRIALLELVQKHIRQRDLTSLLDRLVSLLSQGYTERELVISLTDYLLRSGNFADSQAFIRELAGRLPQHKEAIMTGAEQLARIGLAKGIEQGIEQGRIEGRLEVARAMLADKLDFATVQRVTGLTREQLQEQTD